MHNMQEIKMRIFYGLVCGLATLILLSNPQSGTCMIVTIGCAICYELFMLDSNAKLLPYIPLTLCYIALCIFGWRQLLLRTSYSCIVAILAIIWSIDVGGYAFGKLFGRRRVLPQLSPGKTYAGYFGAIVCASIAHVCARYLDTGCTNLECVAIIATAIAGDLVGSLLKRIKGVKDSSNLIPGHGGVLDRFDSFLPVGYLLQMLMT